MDAEGRIPGLNLIKYRNKISSFKIEALLVDVAPVEYDGGVKQQQIIQDSWI